MKKIITILTIVTCLQSFSQIEITEKVKNIEIGRINVNNEYSMSYTINNEYNLHMFFFKNHKYSYITKIADFYLENDSDVNAIYITIKTALEENKNIDFEITLKKNESLEVSIKDGRVRFLIWDGYDWNYSDRYTLSQINKLFGKDTE